MGGALAAPLGWAGAGAGLGEAAVATGTFLVSNPIGWAILGTAAVVGGGAYIGHKVYQHAHQQSQSKTKDKTAAQSCADCATIPCFKTPENGSPEEMDKQLKEQEDKINSMDPEEIEKNIDKFQQEGRPNDASARSQARNDAQNAKAQDLFDQYTADGMDPAAAKSKAAGEAQDFMRGQDATHDLDWVAGGDGTISGTGGSSENRSIGSQWAKPGDGETQTRAQELKTEAEKAKKAGKKKMNVRLKRC